MLEALINKLVHDRGLSREDLEAAYENKVNSGGSLAAVANAATWFSIEVVE